MAALIGFAIVVQQVIVDGPLVDLDRDLAHRYSNHRVGRVVALARIVSPFGEAGWLLVLVGIAAVVQFQRGQRRDSTFLATAAIGGVLLDVVARVAIGHLRPDAAFPIISRFGLPSGHALDATVCYGALLIVVWPRLSGASRRAASIATAGLVAAVSYSRVVLLTHNLSDVIAGVALGAAWLAIVAAAFSLPSRDRLSPAP